MHRIDSTRSNRTMTLESGFGGEPARAIPPEVCEICFSDLVQPVDAQASSAGSVRMTVRCPECHHLRVGECSWEEAREFGRHFAKGKTELRSTYVTLVDENFREELDRLVLALKSGLIGPDDFAPFRYSN